MQKILIYGRNYPGPDGEKDAVCTTSDTDEATVAMFKTQDFTTWIETAEKIDPPATGVKLIDAMLQEGHGYVGTGNVCSDLLLSSCLRPLNQTACNGQTNLPAGHLLNFDLAGLRDYGLGRVASAIRAHPSFTDHGGYWYLFRHGKRSAPVIYGVLVTDHKHDLVLRFDRQRLGLPYSGVATRVLDAMELRVTSKAWQNRQRIFERTAA